MTTFVYGRIREKLEIERMLGQSSQQLSFGDGFIDLSLYSLDEELKEVDQLISNPHLLRPFEEVFDPCIHSWETHLHLEQL